MRYSFSSSKASWHSSVHSKAFFSILKNSRHLSVTLESNLLRAATLPFRLYTSLTFFGGIISSMAWILSGLASTPYCETMKPRNFPDDTSNAQPGFRLYRNDARYQTSPADRLDGCFLLRFS